MKNDPVGPSAYSYVRFSSKKQEEGDSVRRQTDLTAAWAKRNKVYLDTSLSPDRGVSAFRGKNADIGALGSFLRLVESGRVLPGSYLVVESLDRLTREEIQPALLLVLTLLQKGIRVVLLKPVEMTYDTKSDTTPIILMLVELSRAHSESKVKSERNSEAWSTRRAGARAGTTVFTHKLPAWVEDRGGKLVPIPERAEVVRRIFDLSGSGSGLFRIMTRFKKESVPSFGTSGHWSIAYLGKILQDRRAVGEFQPRVRGGASAGAPIPNYYPQIITEAQWERCRVGTRARHRKPGRIGGRVNLFQGLIKSARDGLAYTVASGTSKKNPHPTIRASGHRVGQSQPDSFPLEVFEQAVLSQLRELDPHEILTGETRDETVELATRLKDVEEQLLRLEAEMVNLAGDVPALVRAASALDEQRRTLSNKLAEARQKGANPLSESWGEAKSLLAALESAPDQREARLRLREALRRIVSVIWLLAVGRGRTRLACVTVTFKGSEGFRDYLIVHRSLTSNARVSKPAWTHVESCRMAARFGALIDPRDPLGVTDAEKVMMELNLKEIESQAQARIIASNLNKLNATE